MLAVGCGPGLIRLVLYAQTLIVGVLSPTRKMHAWCEVDGELPYEPMPEHYLYQPLWTLALTP